MPVNAPETAYNASCRGLWFFYITLQKKALKSILSNKKAVQSRAAIFMPVNAPDIAYNASCRGLWYFYITLQKKALKLTLPNKKAVHNRAANFFTKLFFWYDHSFRLYNFEIKMAFVVGRSH